MSVPKVVEVFADVRCPFTHVGLRRLVAQRAATGAAFVMRVRAWPLELVNDKPLDAQFIAEEVDELRVSVASDLFAGFDPEHFGWSSLPALSLVAAAYDVDLETGERASLMVRDACFELGADISVPEVLDGIARRVGLEPGAADPESLLADYHEGQLRGVIGSPHFFVDGADFFCPALRIQRIDGHMHIEENTAAFDRLVERVVAA